MVFCFAQSNTWVGTIGCNITGPCVLQHGLFDPRTLVTNRKGLWVHDLLPLNTNVKTRLEAFFGAFSSHPTKIISVVAWWEVGTVTEHNNGGTRSYNYPDFCQ